MENLIDGFTSLPHFIEHVLLVDRFKKRELKVLYLIIRLTYGAQGSTWARLKQSDLSIIGIGSTHAKEVFESLLEKKVILKKEISKEYKLNEDYFHLKLPKKVTTRLEKIIKLVGIHLPRSGNKNKLEVTETVTEKLPDQEDLSYQFSNQKELPKRELLRSKKTSFFTPKDIFKEKLQK
jgi:hypothetical protein